jgi:Fe-S-cluster containining protein
MALITDLDRLFQEAMSRFECTQCGTCCQGEGGIHMDPEEIERIARFLSLSPEAFLVKYCLVKNGKVYIHIREDRYCHFAQEGKCSIHTVKPAPCRRWPFLKPMLTDQANWETARNSCPALAPYSSLEDFFNRFR